MQTYTVRLRFKDCGPGVFAEYEVTAASKADATKRAKLQAEREGIWPDPHNYGAGTFTAHPQT